MYCKVINKDDPLICFTMSLMLIFPHIKTLCMDKVDISIFRKKKSSSAFVIWHSFGMKRGSFHFSQEEAENKCSSVRLHFYLSISVVGTRRRSRAVEFSSVERVGLLLYCLCQDGETDTGQTLSTDECSTDIDIVRHPFGF